MTNCPNCGAPLSGDKCKYCGTQLWNFTAIDMEKPSYVKFKHNGKVTIAKVYVDSISVQMEQGMKLYSDSYIVHEEKDYTIDITMGIVPEDGIYWKVMEEE